MILRRVSQALWRLTLAIVICEAACAAEDDFQFFEQRIRPVLVEHCYPCHATGAKSIRGGLLLDSQAGMLRGGDSGPVLIPGEGETSLLVSALRHEAYEMPPGKRLPESAIDDFIAWINRGAADPRVDAPQPAPELESPAARDPRSHWAFGAIGEVSVPQIQQVAWVDNPIDNFVLASLEQQGWRPAPEADRFTLIRRLSFDLRGLPPTLPEIDSFVRDQRPGAYDRLVDRLLADPAYGERWGRHWLDCVRYADTNGADENHAMPSAWRYRDWAIDAMNDDLSYDQMIMQQIAGDLLPTPDDEVAAARQLTATGMLVIGPKMLAEQDKEKMIADIVDEQIDTVSRTFLGLTIACARCHDHKFDPVAAADYYALAGIFTSTKSMANRDFVSQWLERPLPSRAITRARTSHAAQVQAAKERRDKLVSMANSQLMATGQFASLPEKPREHYSQVERTELETLEKEIEALEKSTPQYETAMAVTEADPVDVAVHIRGNHLRQAEAKTSRGAPKCLQMDLALETIPPDQSGRLELAKWLCDPRHPLTARVMVNRIWAWHFGEGLVRSPSNFGYRGEPPTHPELLDFLAAQWVRHDWSIKWLHRQIVTSKLYRMTSDVRTYEQQDPENRLLWRRTPRRLEIEALRDSLLSIAAGLERRFGGPGSGEESARRTVYLQIDRAALREIFSIFDYVDPASHIEQRPVTTVPSQALFLMNHPLVHQQADRLARHLLDQSHERTSQCDDLWRTLYGRPASSAELELSAAYLDAARELVDSSLSEGEQEQQAFASFIRTMIAGEEFLWIP